MRSWLIIALIAAVFFSMYKMNPNPTKVRELTQLEFYRAIEEGKITDPVYRHIDRDGDATYLTGEIEKNDLKADGSPEREPFHMTLVEGENEGLMENLLNANVQVVIKEHKSMLSPFVVQTLFFVGMMGVLYWIMYRKVGGGPFSFGKSKAKLLNEDTDDAKKITFKDVAGIDEAREEVQEIVEFLKEPAAFTKLGGRIPKGVLMVGPPGTGKTLLAKAIAGEAKVPFFAMSGSDFEEMFVGVGASRMRDMFAEAKRRAPCIVFIDEIDSIGMKRTGTGAIGGSHAYEQTLNTMLVEMDGFDANEGVIVIAATNRPDTLDSALLRPGRFDRQVVIDLPTLKGREDILKLHGAKIKFADGVDLTQIARGTPGFSGADLANLLNEAALMATRKKLEGVDMATLEEARDKVMWGRERKSAGYSQHDREITAWHESGHAILQLLLKHTDPLHKVTIIPRGRALGATMSLPEEDVLNRTKSQFLDELVVCCGGRIAEKTFTGEISTGAAQDIRMATDIARKMVCTYGMCEQFGFQAFSEQNTFAASELPPQFSEETSHAIDAEVSKLVHEAYATAEKLLDEHKAKVERLAKTLLEKETMDGKEVEALLGIGNRDAENQLECKSEDERELQDSQSVTAGIARNSIVLLAAFSCLICSAYVPEPRPVKSAVEITALYYPGTEHAPEWDMVAQTRPEAKPLLGWYNEGHPEAIDWQIKWAVEHGITSFCVDWYWNKGYQRLTHWVKGYYRARYRNYLKWYMMYANHNQPGAHSTADQIAVTRYWIDNYFKTPEYYTIDGKPVVCYWDANNLDRDFIAEAEAKGEKLAAGEGIRRAFAISEKMAKEAGLPGIHWQLMWRGSVFDPAYPVAQRMNGFETAISYGFVWEARGIAADVARSPTDLSYDMVAKGIPRMWCSRCIQRDLPWWLPLPTGWDDRPRSFGNSCVVTDRTCEKFAAICRAARTFCDKYDLKHVVIHPINEWQEGSYIEPNEEYGFGMYDAIRDAFCEKPAQGWPKNLTPADVGLGPYDYPPQLRSAVQHWDFTTTTEGWYRQPYGGGELEAKEGCLHFWITRLGNFNIRQRVMPFDAARYDTFRIRMRITPNAIAEKEAAHEPVAPPRFASQVGHGPNAHHRQGNHRGQHPLRGAHTRYG